MPRHRESGKHPVALDGADAGVVMSRRRWRAVHNPPVRRSDPIFGLAEMLLPGASIMMLVASTGIAKRGPIPREPSAVMVILCAVIIVVMLLVLSIRLFVKRGVSPFSTGGAVLLACISVASPLVMWVRFEGVFAPLVVAACVANGLCLVAGGLALFAGRRRGPGVEAPEASEPVLGHTVVGTTSPCAPGRDTLEHGGSSRGPVAGVRRGRSA